MPTLQQRARVISKHLKQLLALLSRGCRREARTGRKLRGLGCAPYRDGSCTHRARGGCAIDAAMGARGKARIHAREAVRVVVEGVRELLVYL